MPRHLEPLVEAGRPIRLFFWCPGCRLHHGFTVDPDSSRSWTWNGNYDRPTVRPAILYHAPRCHLYLTDGNIEFLPDSKHPMAGRTVPMEDVRW
ncbi:MAG TPA: DUF6527 family protein [Bryobacteraceae bacterium]|nr:DUF6527 family protein [Bryobacteraceae bacterium]